jgi:hypothetical protein
MVTKDWPCKKNGLNKGIEKSIQIETQRKETSEMTEKKRGLAMYWKTLKREELT